MVNSLNKLALKLKSLIAVSVIAGMVSVNGFAQDVRDTSEIVEETIVIIYRTNADQGQRNLGDHLNCVDFCHSQFMLGSEAHSSCIAQCGKQTGYLTSE